MKTLFWCVVTTAIGALAGPQFPSADSNSIWLGGGIGLVVGTVLSHMPIIPATWTERIQRDIIWRPNHTYWRNTRDVVANLVITELYLVLFGVSLLTTTALCFSSQNAMVETLGALAFLACLAVPIIAFIILMLAIVNICMMMNSNNNYRPSEDLVVEAAREVRRLALFYNPFILPFTLLYHGAKALRVIR